MIHLGTSRKNYSKRYMRGEQLSIASGADFARFLVLVGIYGRSMMQNLHLWNSSKNYSEGYERGTAANYIWSQISPGYSFSSGDSISMF
jgi:hypothetical protein